MPTEATAQDLLTTAQVAKLLGVQPESIRRYVNRGHLAAITLPGGHRRIRRADVEALIANDPAAQTA